MLVIGVLIILGVLILYSAFYFKRGVMESVTNAPIATQAREGTKAPGMTPIPNSTSGSPFVYTPSTVFASSGGGGQFGGRGGVAEAASPVSAEYMELT